MKLDCLISVLTKPKTIHDKHPKMSSKSSFMNASSIEINVFASIMIQQQIDNFFVSSNASFHKELVQVCVQHYNQCILSHFNVEFWKGDIFQRSLNGGAKNFKLVLKQNVANQTYKITELHLFFQIDKNRHQNLYSNTQR